MNRYLRPYPTIDAAVSALRNKEVGGVVTNSYQARQLAQSQPCDIATADTPLS
jgi:ABC-type amino acid transport substrate-binding protein